MNGQKTSHWWQDKEGRFHVCVWARPGAKTSAFAGIKEDDKGQLWLKISVACIAEDGKANAALIGFLADALRVRQSDVQLISGTTSRQKRLQIAGDAGQIAARLEKLV